MFSFTGKVFVVTGASSGIGDACVTMLRESGASVVGWDLRESDTSKSVDVSDWASVESAADAVGAEFGHVDGLINCAGVITLNLPAQDVANEDYEKNFHVNVMGTIHSCKALYPFLSKSTEPAIVNIASQAALVALPWQTAYSASKGGVAAFTRALAIDWAEQGIRVNAICPGFTLTPMAIKQMTPELEAAVSRRVPLGRMFQPEEMASVACFLASPLASAVTGVVMPVDGGWTAGEPALPM